MTRTIRVKLWLTYNQNGKKPDSNEPDKVLEEKVPVDLSQHLCGLIVHGLVYRDGWAADEVYTEWDFV